MIAVALKGLVEIEDGEWDIHGFNMYEKAVETLKRIEELQTEQCGE